MSDAAVPERGAALHQLRLFLVAVQFLTRVPVPAWSTLGFQPAWLNACVVHFPLVGALVGVVGASVLWGASAVWSPWVAAALSVTATVVLTGAFHEDGLADTFDALGGVVPRERALAIMKDSRIGTYGAAALCLSLVLRVALLAALLTSLGAWQACCALVAAHALGRMAAVVLMHWLPYAGDAEHAKAKPLATSVPRGAMGVAVGVGLVMWLVTAVLSWRVGLAPSTAANAALGWQLVADASHALRWAMAPCVAVAVTGCMGRWLRRRLGGYTGDTLGATVQLCEVSVLLVLSTGLTP